MRRSVSTRHGQFLSINPSFNVPVYPLVACDPCDRLYSHSIVAGGFDEMS